MAGYPVSHPCEGRDPANALLDSGLRRKDDRGEGMSYNFGILKLFTRRYTSTQSTYIRECSGGNPSPDASPLRLAQHDIFGAMSCFQKYVD